MSNPRLSRGAFARLAAICVAVIFASSVAPAVEMHVDHACVGKYADDVKTANKIAAKHPELTITVHEYAGDDAKRFYDTLNAEPPETHIVADRLLTVDGSQHFEWITTRKTHE
jgi:hypothetical protein